MGSVDAWLLVVVIVVLLIIYDELKAVRKILMEILKRLSPSDPNMP